MQRLYGRIDQLMMGAELKTGKELSQTWHEMIEALQEGMQQQNTQMLQLVHELQDENNTLARERAKLMHKVDDYTDKVLKT